MGKCVAEIYIKFKANLTFFRISFEYLIIDTDRISFDNVIMNIQIYILRAFGNTSLN